MNQLDKIIVTEVAEALTVNFPKGVTNKMLNRDTYGISFCVEGHITYNHNGNKVVSTPGKVIFLPKGQSYSIYGDKGGVFLVINFLSPNLFCDTVSSLPIKSVQPYIADFEKIKSLFLFDKNRAKIMSIFYGILHRISSEESEISGVLSPAFEHLEKMCFSADLSVSNLASLCNISEVYFRKLFFRHTGVSPKQYILDIRIEKAKQLLSDGIMKISAISDECGFSSPYHFCRLFKQKTGVTPTDYMNRNRIYKI
ncbi:MAG: AraC family transcriptional regulator [Clostridia bacterium]|nr:AraC family transcriptional regulator [Clostridia bacterium]